MRQKLTVVQHLEEFRKRTIICLIAIFFGSIVCYLFSDRILSILAEPVGKLVFLNPTEAFFSRIRLAFYAGLFISMPVIIHQAWKFVDPALIKTERHMFIWVTPLSCLLFLAGVIFAFFTVLPVGVKILISYGTEIIQPMIALGSYISFVAVFLLAFGIIFQLPIVILFLTKLGIVTPKWLTKNRKYAVLVIFILAGVLTPGPDIFSQILMAIPTLLLYEISILLSKLITPVNKIEVSR